MHELTMPSLGADMEHGKVVEWLVHPGDTVHRGDLIAVVDTDKTVMDVESFEDGVVGEYLVDLGETVAVGTPILRLGTGADQPEVGPTRPAEAPSEHAEALPAEAPQEQPTPREPSSEAPFANRLAPREHAEAPPAVAGAHRVRSSPLARRLAARLGIDLEGVVGTGQMGSVSEADVRRAAAETAGAPASGPRSATEEVPPSAAETGKPAVVPSSHIGSQPSPDKAATIRAALGTLMAKSKATIPHYYLSTTIDLARPAAVMQERNLARSVAERLVPAAFLLKAAAVAAHEVPGVNGFWTDGAFAPSQSVHLGVAVALRGGGLVAPALHDANMLSVDELMEALRDLVARARAGHLLRAEMADATITVTSLGDLGVESVFGVIVPPQVAMVGFGRVVERPWAENGMIGVRPTVTATLSADHRVSDGLGGGRYLTRIQELLLTPEEL
ncbi:dihydrolipoamide acetyltransferase family protein [Sinomonas sp. P10A9]|uniref:Dihydrolipoamide acetyltransferase component of pyruvate dehydrogenase complex n=1 Tax=Sinomonas puerhi TaxID=3238584 RepID=A0AB39KYW9_9MICC